MSLVGSTSRSEQAQDTSVANSLTSHFRFESSRVAFFVPTLRFGGVERVFVNLARGFSERGVQVDLVTPEIGGEFTGELGPQVRLIHLKARRVLTSLPKLVRYLHRERPAAVVAAMEHSSLTALWARELARTPTRIIATVHTNLSQVVSHAPSLRVRLVPFFCRRSLHWADAVVAVSRGVADDLAHHAPRCRDRIRVIYNPVINADMLSQSRESLDHPWFSPGQPPVILGVGRLAKQKDFATLIKAFALVLQRRGARLLILGEGEERAHLEAMVRNLGLDGDVCLPGFTMNPYSYMSRAALFVMSSAWEGFGNVLVEALASGVPVVATDCESGPREILETVNCGQLVPVANVEAMADAIFRSLDARPEMPPPHSLRSFELDSVVDDYLSLLYSLDS
jgi:glycosyltransferase involved in cell wall biosynthesis